MDFELVSPADDVRLANARRSTTKDLYDAWIKFSETHGAHHPFTKEAHEKYRASLEAGKRVK